MLRPNTDSRASRLRCVARATALVAILPLGLAACELSPKDSGPVPEGVRRDMPLPGDPLPRTASGGAAGEPTPIGAPPDTPWSAGGERQMQPTAHTGVLAATASGEYHRHDCSALAAAGAATPYGSAFEALDAGLAPCATCKPGP